MDIETYRSIPNVTPLRPTSTKIYPYGTNKELPLVGEASATVATEKHTMETTFYVTEAGRVPLLSYDTARQLGLIQVTLSAVSATPSNTCTKPTVSDSLVKEYPELFTGLGKLANYQAELHIDQTVQPVAQRHRRRPFHLRKLVEKALLDLESKDIIERVDGPTPWVSPIVPVPQTNSPDQVHICVDM